MNLSKGAVLRVAGPSVVEVGRGEVWITRYGDSADYFVAAGQSFLLEGTDDAVISATKDASLVVTPAGRPAFWWEALARA
jgi:hypothetical protein